MRQFRKTKGKGKAPVGYVYCKEQWVNVLVCEQCKKQKRCLIHKTRLQEQKDGEDSKKGQLQKRKSNKVARRTRKRRSK